MAVLTLAIPSYNSAQHIARCLDSLIPGGDALDVIIINDGSTDATQAIAERYVERYPQTFRLFNQENQGHGSGINRSLQEARAPWFKVLDSDDFFDEEALLRVLRTLIHWDSRGVYPDLILTNYVYEYLQETHGDFTYTQKPIRYTNVFHEFVPQIWDDMRAMKLDQLLMMHVMIYRTSLLRDEVRLQLPHKTSYEDNLYVCVPLPQVRSIRYLNEDLYHYCIDRPEQSVNLNTMIKKADDQLGVTKAMLHAFDDWMAIEPVRLQSYLIRHFTRLVAMCLLTLSLRPEEESKAKIHDLWSEIKAYDRELYLKIRTHPMPIAQSFLNSFSPELRAKVYRWIGKTWRFS